MVHRLAHACTVRLFWSGRSFLAQEGIEGIKEGRTLALDYFSCDTLVVDDCCVKLILFVK